VRSKMEETSGERDGGQSVRWSGRGIGLLQIHLAVVLASGPGLFAKFMTVNPAVLTTGRTFFGSLSLIAAALLSGSSMRIHSARDFLLLLISGALLAVHWMTFFQSIQVSTVAVGLLSISSFPLFLTFLEPIFFRERIRLLDVALGVVVVAGLALVPPSFDFGDHVMQGVLWGVGSALAYALLSLVSRLQVRRYPAVSVVLYQQSFAALCSLPLALHSSGSLSGRDLWLLVLLGVVFTGIAQWLAVSSLRHLRAYTTGLIFGLEPVYGILLAWFFLREAPGWRTFAGGVLILGAVIVASLMTEHPEGKTESLTQL